MDKKIISVIFVVSVAIIVIGGLMMPIINDTDHSVKYHNEPDGLRFDKADTFTATTGYINDVGLDAFGSGPVVLFTDKFVGVAHKGTEWGVWTFFPDTGVGRITGSLSVTAGEYTITPTTGTATTGQITMALIPSINGAYGLIGTGNYRVVASSEIYTVGYASSNYGVSVGTYDNQTTVFKVVDAAPVEGFDVELQYSVVKDTTAYDLEGKDVTDTMYVIAPLDVTYSQSLGAAAEGLIFAIPIILICALLVAVVAAFRSRY